MLTLVIELPWFSWYLFFLMKLFVFCSVSKPTVSKFWSIYFECNQWISVKRSRGDFRWCRFAIPKLCNPICRFWNEALRNRDVQRKSTCIAPRHATHADQNWGRQRDIIRWRKGPMAAFTADARRIIKKTSAVNTG